MANEELRNAIVEKIRNETFAFADMRDYFQVVTEVCNEDDKIQKKTAKDNVSFQFNIEDGDDYWLKVEHGAFSFGVGKMDAPDMVIGMDARTTTGIFGNTLSATSAYLNRDMSFKGSASHGLKFRSIFKMVNKILDI